MRGTAMGASSTAERTEDPARLLTSFFSIDPMEVAFRAALKAAT